MGSISSSIQFLTQMILRQSQQSAGSFWCTCHQSADRYTYSQARRRVRSPKGNLLRKRALFALFQTHLSQRLRGFSYELTLTRFFQLLTFCVMRKNARKHALEGRKLFCNFTGKPWTWSFRTEITLSYLATTI